MSNYKIEQITPDEAETVWHESYQSSIFTHPQVLEELAEEVHWWGVFKGEELRCAWPVALNEKSESTIAPFTYWQSPLWAKDIFDQPYHRAITLTTSVYELFIRSFIENYGSIKASLHPSLMDVRVFDWWNYHETSKPRFSIKPRYSGSIYVFDKSIEDIENSFRRDRRRDLKLSKKAQEKVYFDSHCSQEELISMYSETLEVNKFQVEKSLVSLLKIVENGHGWIQSVRKKADSTLCGLAIILQDKQQANLVVNIADSDFKYHRLMASAVLKAIETTKQKGLKYFDFNGANSPLRGDDKHSYGAKPVLYFDLEYKDTN